MARAQVRTSLPLDTFARLAGISPLHFNGLDHGNCGNPILQYGWQMPGSDERGGRIGREDIAAAVQLAEQTLEEYLGFALVPRWVESEEHSLTPVWGYGVPSLDLGQRHYISGGIEQRVVIEADAGITYSDEDDDGYFETATIGPISTAVLNPNEIALYYPASSDYPIDAASDAWEIRPIRVAVDAEDEEITITCRREQLVLPHLIEGVIDADSLDADARDDDANFLEVVDVYRRFNDPQRQVQFFWPNPQCGSCSGAGCGSCSYTTQYGCLRGRDMAMSSVSFHPADWNTETLEFDQTAWSGAGRPYRARAWYLAGYQDQRKPRPLVDMADKYAQAVTILALSLLPGPLCACMTQSYALWSEDLARQYSEQNDGSGHTLSYRVGKRVLDNPLGTSAGAKRAYELVHRDKIGESANFVLPSRSLVSVW